VTLRKSKDHLLRMITMTLITQLRLSLVSSNLQPNFRGSLLKRHLSNQRRNEKYLT
jgi:hypothetical protein